MLEHTKKLYTNDDNETIPADEMFKELDRKHGVVGSTIRGFRARDNMTQTELARRLGVHQSNVSQIEYSKRAIGKKMAEKLAKIFKTSYRLFYRLVTRQVLATN